MTKIEIKTNPKFRPLRAIYVFAVVFGIFGAGVAADSAAMQWFWFAFLLLWFLAMVRCYADENTGLSIAEARKRLDEIEAEEEK